jgi:hypothetical protein
MSDLGYIKGCKSAIVMLLRDRNYLKPKIKSDELFGLGNAAVNIPRLSHRPQLSFVENVDDVGFRFRVTEPLIDVVAAERPVCRME